jgi:hypothetical protein
MKANGKYIYIYIYIYLTAIGLLPGGTVYKGTYYSTRKQHIHFTRSHSTAQIAQWT